jgi:HupE / UreJ protein
MMIGRWVRFAAVGLACTLLAPIVTGAHDLPLDRMMNAFVKIEPRQADLVIRVPLDLLRVVPFPLEQGGRYNLAASRPAVEMALKALASDLSFWENGVRLAPSSQIGHLTPLSDRSFEDYDRAVAEVAEPLAPDTKISFELGYLDARFVYPITSPKSVFAFQSKVARDLGDYTKLTMRYLPLGETGRAMLITGSGRVSLDPPWHEASAGFVVLGIRHILSGVDHLLFLLCLIIPYRRITGLIPVITAFTLGHSVTLIGTAYNLAPIGAWFPPFVETAIAASIFYMAIENIIGANLGQRWVIAGLFGLVHGFGFADVLKEQLQFAGSYLLVSLISFNIGIEIGQLAVLCVFVPGLALLFRGRMAGRMGIIVISAIVANIAWQWMVQRGEVLWQTPWPQLTLPAAMMLARWVAALVLAVGAAKLLAKWIERKWPGLSRPA